MENVQQWEKGIEIKETGRRHGLTEDWKGIDTFQFSSSRR